MFFWLVYRATGVLPYQALCCLLLSVVWLVGALHVLMAVFMLEPESPGADALLRLHNTIRGTFSQQIHRNSTTTPSFLSEKVPSFEEEPVVLDLKLTKTLLFVGWLVGASLWSAIGDKYGRRYTCFACLLLLIVADACQIFAPNFEWFLASRVLVGFTKGGAGVLAYVWGVEYLTYDPLGQMPPRAKAAGAIYQVMWSLGGCVLPLAAFYLPYWKHFTLFLMGLTAVLAVLVLWLVPESPKWLRDCGSRRQKEMQELAERIQRFNERRNLTQQQRTYARVRAESEAAENGSGSSAAMPPFARSQKFHREDVILAEETVSIAASSSHVTGHKEPAATAGITTRCCQPPRIFAGPFFLVTALLSFIWFTNAIVFYGINLNASVIPGNVYIVTLILNLFSIPGQIISVPTISWWGCRRSLLWGLFLLGIAFLGMAAVDLVGTRWMEANAGASRPPWISPALVSISVVGDFLVNMTYALCYIMTADSYPTAFRGIGVGFGVMVGRLGAMSSTLIPKEWMYWVFGGVSLVASVCTYFMPRKKQREVVNSGRVRGASTDSFQSSITSVNVIVEGKDE